MALIGKKLSDFSMLDYKCACGKVHSLKSKIVSGCYTAVLKQIKRAFPAGKVLLLAENDFAVRSERVKEALEGFEVITCVLGSDDELSSLFALPEDVRAVVIMGGGFLFNAGRYFATIRKILCVAVPCSCRARDLVSRLVTIKVGGIVQSYPAIEPMLIVVDPKLMSISGQADVAFSHIVSKQITLIDVQMNSVFNGQKYCNELACLMEEAIAQAVRSVTLSGEQRALQLFEASFKTYFCEQAGLTSGFEETIGEIISESLDLPAGTGELCAYKYLSHIYLYFFENGFFTFNPVPDYLKRIICAARMTKRSSAMVMKSNSTPNPAQLAASITLFEECKAGFISRSRTCVENIASVEKTYKLLGGKPVEVPPQLIKRAFTHCAELNTLVSVPTLMRDFGLLAGVDAPAADKQ